MNSCPKLASSPIVASHGASGLVRQLAPGQEFSANVRSLRSEVTVRDARTEMELAHTYHTSNQACYSIAGTLLSPSHTERKRHPIWLPQTPGVDPE